MSEIFVFGSNLAGRHGKGAALYARQHHGAIYGQGDGLQGSSYAIPTKDANLKSRTLNDIAASVAIFLEFATAHPEMQFRVTPIGCGLAGYRPCQIAWMFDLPLPGNIHLPEEFAAVLRALADGVE